MNVKRFRMYKAVVLWAIMMPAMVLPAAAQEIKTVVAEGRSAAQDLGRAFDEAKEDAFREAISQAAGVWVDAETITKNYKLLGDLVRTKSAGFIRSYEVISKGQQDDFYVVKISADIIMTQLKSDLQAIGLLREVTGGQRIMVVGVEKVEGQPQSTSFVQQPLEAALLAKGFDVVSQSQMEAVKERDVALNFDDYTQAAALGQRLNAELVVAYTALASYAGQENLYGSLFHRYEVNVTAKIIKVDTARVRQSINSRGSFGAASAGAAAHTALERAGREAAPRIVDGVIAALEREFLGEGADLEVFVNKIDFKNHLRLKDQLGKIRNVKSVGTAQYTNGTGIYRIKATMQADKLAEQLMNLEGFEINITGVDQNRVTADWGAGGY